MELTALPMAGAYMLSPSIHRDERGSFAETYRHEALREALGHPLELAQVNTSTSRQGVVRGLHFADVPPGQAKYVSCVSGTVLDVILDIRLGSPTFGALCVVTLDDRLRRAVYIGEGLAHAFGVLSESATMVYLCSTVHTPTAEHGLSPVDPALDLPWVSDPDVLGSPIVLSAKDAGAPTLAEAQALGALPTLQQCQLHEEWLRTRAMESTLTSGQARMPGRAG